jgi:hypothetical protein
MPEQNAAAKQTLLKDIRLKWAKLTEVKLTEQEVTRPKTTMTLLPNSPPKRGLNKAVAQRDAAAGRKGRNI